MGGDQRDWKLAYVVGTYPLLTTTFIDREVEALDRLGSRPRIVSIKRPKGRLSEAQQQDMHHVTYILPTRWWVVLAAHARMLSAGPGAYLGTLFYLVSRPHPDAMARMKTVAHFGLGVVVADVLRRDRPTHLHAHFVDRAAIVAMVVSRLLDVSYSATAHANDIYVRPILLPEKIAESSFVATCTGYNADHLRRISEDPARIRKLYHGLNLERLVHRPRQPQADAILAVGQLKEKKGFVHLIRAIGLLRDRGVGVSCAIIGDGPLQSELQDEIEHLGLSERVELVGAMAHDEVMERLRSAVVFVLPCVVAVDGDRDGIPNVILEAMATSIPVISTTISGIPEVVDHGVTGLLVEPGDPDALADALEGLLSQPLVAERMGMAGRRVVEERFDVDRNAELLLEQMRQVVAT